MKLYHGSPKDLDTLKPQVAKGLTDFENMKAVFLTDDFIHAALYAIGKTLKGKTCFGVMPRSLVIVGDLIPGNAFVYEVEIEKPLKGERGQYAFKEEISPKNKTKVFIKDYQNYILRVNNREELLKKLRVSKNKKAHKNK